MDTLRDPLTGSAITMGFIHHLVHIGELFNAVDKDADVDIASPKYWMLRTPADVEAHIILVVSASGGYLAELYEAPTVTGDGTPVVVQPFNMAHSKTPTVLFFKDTTVSDDGTLKSARYAGGTGVAKTKFGGDSRPEAEFILDEGQDYIVKVTALADDTGVTIEGAFYEIPEG